MFEFFDSVVLFAIQIMTSEKLEIISFIFPKILGSYLAHTQGKKHQSNLARRAAKEATDQPYMPLPQQVKVEPKKFVKIGRPGYKVYYL